MKLCDRGKETVKRKFKVYPSIYANSYASQVCQGIKPDYKGNYIIDPSYKDKKNKQNSGLNRWFKEKWIDICTGEPCGRPSESIRKYPLCRPTIKISDKTPKLFQELNLKNIIKLCKEKQRNPKKRIKF